MVFSRLAVTSKVTGCGKKSYSKKAHMLFHKGVAKLYRYTQIQILLLLFGIHKKVPAVSKEGCDSPWNKSMDF